MGLIDQANKDIQQITSNSDEFGVSISLTAPSGEKATIIGIHPKTTLGVDNEGNVINSRQARITFSEQILINTNPLYPLRNSSGEVDMKGHLVDVVDSTGTLKNYQAQSWTPDETIGLIVVMLSNYGADN